MLVDRFLEDATEVDVDSIRDRTGEVFIGGVMEHVEEAGVHSGDSACVIPPPTLSADVIEVIESHTRAIADALDVCGPLNVQYAVKQGQVFVIEANPRASRTVPFVAKATGVPLAKVAARVMVGATLAELRAEGLLCPAATGGHVAVKEAVLPFNRFPEADTLLGPEMRATGEVMGISSTFGLAFAKSQAGAGDRLPASGTVFLSLSDRDKAGGLRAARQFVDLGFSVVATSGTARYFDGERGGGGRRGAAAGPSRTVGRRAHRQRRDRPGRQHPPGSGPAGRRGLHPHRGQRPQRALPDHGGGRPGRGQRHRRRGRARVVGAVAAGVPRPVRR